MVVRNENNAAATPIESEQPSPTTLTTNGSTSNGSIANGSTANDSQTEDVQSSDFSVQKLTRLYGIEIGSKVSTYPMMKTKAQLKQIDVSGTKSSSNTPTESPKAGEVRQKSDKFVGPSSVQKRSTIVHSSGGSLSKNIESSKTRSDRKGDSENRRVKEAKRIESLRRPIGGGQEKIKPSSGSAQIAISGANSNANTSTVSPKGGGMRSARKSDEKKRTAVYRMLELFGPDCVQKRVKFSSKNAQLKDIDVSGAKNNANASPKCGETQVDATKKEERKKSTSTVTSGQLRSLQFSGDGKDSVAEIQVEAKNRLRPGEITRVYWR